MIPLAAFVSVRTEKELPKEHPHLPFIGLDDIEAHTMRLVGTKPSTSMKSAAKRFYRGDVLYSRLRPYLNKVWPADRDGLCSAEFIVLPGNDLIDAKFLAFRLNASDFVAFASGLNAGDRPRVDFDQISSFFLPPFSLKRQRRIVAKIEELFSELDAGVENLKKARAQLGIYRQALLKKAFEGKLTEKWRAEHASELPTAEQLLARIQEERDEALRKEITSWKEAYKKWEKTGHGKKPPKPSKHHPEVAVNTVGPDWLPPGWHYFPLSAVIISLGQGWSPKCERRSKAAHEWGVITTTSIQPLDFRPEENKALPLGLLPRPWLQIEEGDLLITRAGPRSRCGVVCRVKRTLPRLIVCDKAYRIRLPEGWLSSKFIEPLLNAQTYSRAIEHLKTGINDSGVNITQSRFLRLQIPIPPLAEQQEIVRILEEQFTAIAQNENEIDAALQRAEALRQSILKKAFSGKLVPQDPSDEPASLLLERIRREREAEARSKRRINKVAQQ